MCVSTAKCISLEKKVNDYAVFRVCVCGGVQVFATVLERSREKINFFGLMACNREFCS